MVVPVKVVAARVDWLTLAYRVALSKNAVGQLTELSKCAREHGTTSVRIGDVVGEMKFNRTPKVWHIKSARYQIHILEKAAGSEDMPEGKLPGWTVEIIWSGVEFLAWPNVDELIAESRVLASAFGEVFGARLRRTDLCADIAGVSARELGDVDRFVRRQRATLDTHGVKIRKEEEQPRARVHYNHQGVTGVTVCPRGVLTACIYDKREELAVCDVEGKEDGRTEAEETRWRDGGWNGTDPVTRVEFRISGVACSEFGIRNPELPVHPKTGEPLEDCKSFGDRVDAVWQRCLQWLRYVDLTHDRPSECPDSLIWEELKAVRFVRESRAAIRVRVRKHASADQVLGSMLSLVGATIGLEERRPWLAKYTSEPAGKHRRELRELAAMCADVIADRQQEKWKTPEDALAHLWEVHDAKRAFFGDEEPTRSRHHRYKREEYEGIEAALAAGA